MLGLATDKQGNVFIVDGGNNRVRRVDAKSGIVTTVVGNGTAGFSGDGGPATSASINLPVISGFFGSPIAFDGSGNLYITDIGNMVVRRVDATTGVINTVAGNGVPGFAGDGGPAVNAELNFPISLAVTASGIIFINDSGNFVIRRVDQSGNISTYAGQGGIGFCGDSGSAINACLFLPQGLAVDSSGDLFIADTGNNLVRRVDGASQIITTIAGDGFQGFAGDGGPALKATLNQLADVGFDSQGNLLIVDNGNNRIRTVRASDQIIRTQAGGGTGGDGGPAFQATLADPAGVTAGPEGDLFITELSNNRIRKVDHTSGLIRTVAGNGLLGFSGDNSPATSASIDMPEGPVAFDGAGNFYIADANNRRIREVSAATGVINTVAGNGGFCFPFVGSCGDSEPAVQATFFLILGVAVDSNGNIFITDAGVNKVRRVDAATGIITTIAGNGFPGFSGDGGPAIDAELNFPFGINVDGAGNLFIGDTFNNRIRRVDAITGIITTVAGNGIAGRSGDGGPATSASLNFPLNAAVDSSGNLYIADGFNDVVRYVAASDQIITTIAGNGVLGFSGDGGPATQASLDLSEVGVDQFNHVLIADGGNSRVRSFLFVPDPSNAPHIQTPAYFQLAGSGQSVLQSSLPGARLAISNARSGKAMRLVQACQVKHLGGPACSNYFHPN